MTKEYGHLGLNNGAKRPMDRIFLDIWGAGQLRIQVGRKVYRFSDSDQFGPVLEDRKGEPLKRQPGDRHQFWEGYLPWKNQGRKMAEDGVTCIWEAVLR